MEEITKIIEKIDPNKITALVTDNAANCVKAREMITSRFPNIINLRCIAHFVNLITKDIMGMLLFIIYLFKTSKKLEISGDCFLNFS